MSQAQQQAEEDAFHIVKAKESLLTAQTNLRQAHAHLGGIVGLPDDRYVELTELLEEAMERAHAVRTSPDILGPYVSRYNV